MIWKRLYAFRGQSASIRSLLYEAGLSPAVTLVDNAERLRGLDRGTFVHVQNHPVPVPLGIWQEVELNGMNIIVLSDELARARAKERMRA